MRIVMPLFEYESIAMDSYSFTSFPFHIERQRDDEIIDTKLFSDEDMSCMWFQPWCLVFDGNYIKLKQYIERSNLLLMAFRVAIQCKGPFIKYRLCENIQYCRRLNEPMLHNYETGINEKIFNRFDLEKVDSYFGRLIEMNSVSTRTKNALYFTFRGMSAAKWIDAFMIYMAAIESLFSKNKPGGTTEVIKTRVASLLNRVNGTTKEDVGALYDLRSEMTHGRIEISDDPKENLQLLAELQHLLYNCLGACRT